MADRGSGGASAAKTFNPQLAQAMEKAAAERPKMDSVACVQPCPSSSFRLAMKLDRDAAIKPPESGAGDVAKWPLGEMLGGLGRPQQQEKPAATAAPKQSTMMKVMTKIRDVQTTSLAASLFQAPTSYRAVRLLSGTGK